MVAGKSSETLGRDVIPIHYAVRLAPNLKSFRYSGSVVIRLDVKKSMSEIRLNAGDITIKKAMLFQKMVRQEAKVIHNRNAGILTLKTVRKVKGKVELSIDFQGKNGDNMAGFYRTAYTAKGKKAYNLSTQFEPADARQMIPCFDEPALKATFALALELDNGLEAVSNMPIKKTSRLAKGKKIVVFETTPKMSTYLLYVGVGRFDMTEDRYRNIRLRVLSTPGKKKLTRLPMLYLKKFLLFQENYFGIRYALPKLDLVAVPDFAHGAMENWGAITFRETALLDDIDSASESSKLRIAEVIAHELAHQWFGDLVTMKWWDEIWLNESFADFMENKSVEAVFPQWQTAKRYTISTIGTALAADQLESTHPVHVKVRTPEELGSVFDAISYQKGSSILTMLDSFIGREIFRKGLHSYLSSNKFRNAEGKDLWDSLQRSSNHSGKRLPVSKMMESWVEKIGYPVIDVKKSSKGFNILQKRYTLLKEYSGIWPVPINYMTEKGEGKLFLDGAREMIPDGSPWIKLNHGQTGFYRVRYDEGLLRELGSRIKCGEIGDVDTWGIVNDLFSFVRTGRESLDIYIDFVDRYCLGCGYPANAVIMAHLDWLNSISSEKSFVYKARRTALSFNSRIIDKLGWEVRREDDLITIGLRNSAIIGLGRAHSREAILKAEGMLTEHFSRKKRINANMLMPVYALAAMNGDRKLFDRFLNIYKSAAIPVERIYGLQALGSFEDNNLADKALRTSLNDAIRLQDKVYIPAQMAFNPQTKSILWEWEKKNWKTFKKIFGLSVNMLDVYVRFSSLMCDEKEKQDFVLFFGRKENKRGDISKAIVQTTETIDANIAFMKRNSGAE